ncbi:hypothetical protein ERJ75_000563100 [Trypanosoma vivax]|nr:hypothetical protein ERJ75_000563100 [Trypanosoma vivax]
MAWLCNDPANTAATTGCGGNTASTATCPCDPGDTKDIAKAGVTWSKMLSRSGTASVNQHGATSGQLNKNWQTTLAICERRAGRKHTVAHLTSSENTRAKTEALKQLLRNGLSSKKKCLASARASTCAATAEDDGSACVCYEGSDATRRPPWEASMDELAHTLRLAEEARRQALKLEQRIERQAENNKNQGRTDAQAPREQEQNVNSTDSQDAGLPHDQPGTDSTQTKQGTGINKRKAIGGTHRVHQRHAGEGSDANSSGTAWHNRICKGTDAGNACRNATRRQLSPLRGNEPSRQRADKESCVTETDKSTGA